MDPLLLPPSGRAAMVVVMCWPILIDAAERWIRFFSGRLRKLSRLAAGDTLSSDVCLLFPVCNILKRSGEVFGDLLCVMWGVSYINGLSCSLFRRGIYFGYVRFVIKA